ncbi:MAG TPA: peptidoglycan editing factor PgeF [Clostridiaceae bacterium]|nr:peptidoglycan editing factor PgeF [Clostridiaceae bacterium]
MKDDKNLFFQKNGVKLLKFRIFEQYNDKLVHCFTTRIGGVSTGECESLNLGFKRRDSRENVIENYKRVCSALDINIEDIVLSDQVHDKKIKTVYESDRGKGILKNSDIIGVDGLITNKKNIALVTFYADCVPVYIFDTGKTAIGLAHSGWKGTLKEIAREMVEKMHAEYGSRPSDMKAVIGPSIGKCCFEVGDEVVDAFLTGIPWSKSFISKNDGEKWKIDLKAVVKKTLMNSGVLEENIEVSNICTKCCKSIFFSYRGDEGKTGSLAAIMQLK